MPAALRRTGTAAARAAPRGAAQIRGAADRPSSKLREYGAWFTEADLNDGWSRLRALSGKRLATKTQPLPGAAAARELLAARGLSAATLTEVEDLLKKLPTVREPPSPIGPTLEEQTVAENAMWDWYLEWAQLARATLHDRRPLRQLGFFERRGGAEVGEPLDEVSGTEEEDDDEVALAAAS